VLIGVDTCDRILGAGMSGISIAIATTANMARVKIVAKILIDISSLEFFMNFHHNGFTRMV